MTTYLHKSKKVNIIIHNYRNTNYWIHLTELAIKHEECPNYPVTFTFHRNEMCDSCEIFNQWKFQPGKPLSHQAP